MGRGQQGQATTPLHIRSSQYNITVNYGLCVVTYQPRMSGFECSLPNHKKEDEPKDTIIANITRSQNSPPRFSYTYFIILHNMEQKSILSLYIYSSKRITRTTTPRIQKNSDTILYYIMLFYLKMTSVKLQKRLFFPPRARGNLNLLAGEPGKNSLHVPSNPFQMRLKAVSCRLLYHETFPSSPAV